MKKYQVHIYCDQCDPGYCMDDYYDFDTLEEALDYYNSDQHPFRARLLCENETLESK